MVRERKRYSAEFKLKATLAVLKGEKTAAQLAGELGIHPMALSEWKHQLLNSAHEVFEKGKQRGSNPEDEKAELFQEIGRLKMELEWLKKKSVPRFG